MPRSAGVDLTLPIDVADPRFLRRIELAQDVAQDVFSTLQGLMKTLSKTIAKGVDYTSHLQQVVDTMISFADMVPDEVRFRQDFTALRRAVDAEKDLIRTLITWETRLQMELSPHTDFFTSAAKKYALVQPRFATDFSKFVKSRSVRFARRLPAARKGLPRH